MCFTEKLDFLIRTFNTNNSKLARAINVDPSLISKWRSGTRTLSPNSPYIELLADYFLNIDLLQHQKDILINLLRPFNPNINICSRSQLKKPFIEWLFSAEHVSEKKDMFQNDSSMDLNYSISNLISKFTSFTDGAPNTDDINTQVQTEIKAKEGKPVNIEVFIGNEGKRQVVLNILNALSFSEKPVQLLFCDEAGLDWLIEDKAFLLNFNKVLKQLVAVGHKILIIHYVNRDSNQIMSIMDFWIPLYLTGRVDSYYYPKYTENVHKKTLCVAPDIAAIFTISPNSSTASALTMTSPDPFVIKLAEEIFLSFLAKCRPLAKTYESTNMGEFYQAVSDMEEKLGFYYTLRDGLTALTMPPDIYAKLLDSLPLTLPEKEERLKLHHKRIEAFNRNIAYYKYVEILNIEAFDKFYPEKFFRYNGLEFFTQEAVKCTPADFTAHLTNVIRLLKKHENYEVILIKLNEMVSQNRVSLSVKEDSTIIIASYDSGGNNPIAFITHEDHIIGAFENYLTHLIDYVPETKRRKEFVIQKLEEKVAKLKEWSKRID